MVAIPEHSVAHATRVPLLWWPGNCGQASSPRKSPHRDGIHWSEEKPTCHEIIFNCFGSMNRSKTTFRVDCVSPQTPMPDLHNVEKLNFVKVLKARLEAQTGMRILGLAPDLVDWQGINTI